MMVMVCGLGGSWAPASTMQAPSLPITKYHEPPSRLPRPLPQATVDACFPSHRWCQIYLPQDTQPGQGLEIFRLGLEVVYEAAYEETALGEVWSPGSCDTPGSTAGQCLPPALHALPQCCSQHGSRDLSVRRHQRPPIGIGCG